MKSWDNDTNHYGLNASMIDFTQSSEFVKQKDENILNFDQTSDDSNLSQNFGDCMRAISTQVSSEQEQMAQYIHSVASNADAIRAMTDKKFAADHGYKIPATLLNDNQFKDAVNKASKIFFGGIAVI